MAEKSPASQVELIMAAQVGFAGNSKVVRYFYSDRMGKHYPYPRRDGHIDLPAMSDAQSRTHAARSNNLHSSTVKTPFGELPATSRLRRSCRDCNSQETGQADSVFRMTHVFEKAHDTVLRTEPVDSSQ